MMDWSYISNVVFCKERSLFPHIHFRGFDDFDKENMARLRSLFDCKQREFLILSTSCLLIDNQLRQLLNLLESVAKSYTNEEFSTIDDMRSALACNTLGYKHALIVLYHAEALQKLPATALQAFFALPKNNDIHIRIATLSRQPFNCFEGVKSIHGVPQAEFNIYPTQSEERFTQQIYSSTGADPQLVRLVVGTVYPHTTDVTTIERIILLAIEKIAEASEAENFTGQKKMQIISMCVKQALIQVETGGLPPSSSESFQSLPICSRILLLASFCASHNSPASDKRFFAKHHGKEKRSDKRERAADLAAETKDAGPKQADMQRIYFIFLALLNEIADDVHKKQRIELVKVVPLFDIGPQLSTLVSMSLIARTSAATNFDAPKFRCLLSYDTVNRIARSIMKSEDNWLRTYLERTFV